MSCNRLNSKESVLGDFLAEEFRIEIKVSEKMLIRNIIRDLRRIIAEQKLYTTEKLVNALLNDEEVKAMLNATNAIVVDYLRYNDHGWAHAVITTRNAIKILSIIRDSVPPNIVKYEHGSFDDAAFVVALAAFLHDVGNMIHRDLHWLNSVRIAEPVIWRYINEFYGDENSERKWLLFAHVANSIFCHDENVQAFTIEASAVKVGDGCDMAAGRSRRPYSIGKVDIHSVSALSITEVDITSGMEKPLRIIINMSNPAGIFQVEEILLPKLKTSLLYDKTEIVTLVDGKPLKLSKGLLTS